MIRATLVALCVLLLSPWSGAHAQEASPDAEGSARQDLLDSAQASFNLGEYQVALEKFRQLYELVPRASITFNIGLCLQRLGRMEEAVETYRTAINSGELGEEGEARAAENLTRAEASMATIESSSPTGAELVVADETCIVPCQLRVDPGTHVVLIRFESRESTQNLTLSPGGQEEAFFRAAPEILDPPGTDAISAESGYSPGPMFAIGAGLAVVGGGGILGFGLRTDALHNTYLQNVATATADQSNETADEGELMMALANASIGVAAIGGVLILIDLLMGL